MLAALTARRVGRASEMGPGQRCVGWSDQRQELGAGFRARTDASAHDAPPSDSEEGAEPEKVVVELPPSLSDSLLELRMRGGWTRVPSPDLETKKTPGSQLCCCFLERRRR